MRFLNELTPLNLSNTSVDELSPSAHSWKMFWVAATVALIVFTVSGNAVTLYVVCRMKSFQSSISNMYISSLAAADIVVGSFVMPFMMLYTVAFDGRWIFGDVLCDIWQAVDFISCTISLYSICAIGFDRWLNLEKPLRIFKRSKVVAKKAILLVWILPVVIWVPILLTIRFMNSSSTSSLSMPYGCNVAWRPTFIVPVIAALIFYLPVLILIVLFVRIASVIRSHFAFLHQHSNRNLLDLDRSHNGRVSSRSERSPSVTPVPQRRESSMAPRSPLPVRIPNTHSPKYRSSRPPKLSVIHQDDSSKGKDRDSNGTINISSPFFLQTPTPSTNTGNQSPLAIMLMRERLSPTMKEEISHFILPSIPHTSTPDSLSTKRSSLQSVRMSENTPLLTPMLGDHTKKNSASKESLDDEKSDKSPSPIQPGDQKRSSVTSDTAVFFTKRVMMRQPPLERAKTELTITVTSVDVAASRRPGRFSIVSITNSFTNLSRRCSVNIFNELLPCAGSISQQIRAAKAVGVIMLVFLICWIPFLILWPMKAYCAECVSDRMYHLAIWANYLNSTLNPVIYTLCSPRFQHCVRGRCKCNCFPKAKDCSKSLLL